MSKSGSPTSQRTLVDCDSAPSVYQYEWRKIWFPSFRSWEGGIVAVDHQANALVWLHQTRSGINGCHVLTNEIFAWFGVRGEPVWIEPADLASYSAQVREGWEIGVVPLLTIDRASSDCPITPDKLMIKDASLHDKMKAASEEARAHIYALACPALAWWPDTLLGGLGPRPTPRLISLVDRNRLRRRSVFQQGP